MPTFMTQARSIFCVGLLLPIAACSTADDAKQANCDTLVSETSSACQDMISRGLDVSCNTYLGAIGLAMKQAGGDLFDVGEANQASANSFCSTYVDKLRKEREAHADSMHAKDEASPQCAALADHFETSCMANLGKESLPGKCRNVARTFVMGSISSKMSQEQVCTIAGMQLPKE